MLIDQSIQIARVETGIQTYVHRKYALSLDPFRWSYSDGEEPSQYLGICIDSSYEDPADKDAYTWSSVSGDAGRSIDSITEQYYASTSNTAQTGGSWIETFPTSLQNRYLWTRFKICYINPEGTSYTEPVLDSTLEKVSNLDHTVTTLRSDFTAEQGRLTAYMEETTQAITGQSSSINELTSTVNGTTQTLTSLQTTVNTNTGEINGIKSDITTINTTASGLAISVQNAQDTADGAQNTATAAESLATVNAGKISWLVKSGSNASNFELTDRAIELVSENINLTGKVTFNSLDTATQNKLNNALTEARVEYAQSTSSTQAPQFGWSETCPAKETGKYIWQRTITIDTQNNEVVSTPVCISGKDGEDAIVLSIESSNGNMFKNSAISTVLTVTIYYGNNTITDSTFFHTVFGPDAYLTWYQKPYGSDTFSAIPSNDPRLSDEGFMLTVSANDVFNKCTFECEFSDS